MLEEEQSSRLEFEKKNMMAKFSQHMAKLSKKKKGNQQVITLICFPPCKFIFLTWIAESEPLFAGA
jgi:hypothetical protein